MSDDTHPLKECGTHHKTGEPSGVGDYPRCCCGDTWLSYPDVCITGEPAGAKVITDPQEVQRKQAQNAPYLRLQLAHLMRENAQLKDDLDKANTAAANDIWEKIGLDSVLAWKRKAEAAEAELAILAAGLTLEAGGGDGTLQERFAEALAEWAWMYPIPGWGLAEGDNALRLARRWGKVAAKSAMLVRDDELAAAQAKLAALAERHQTAYEGSPLCRCGLADPCPNRRIIEGSTA